VTAGRILALRQLGLGDFCTGVPALRALRRAYPTASIHLAAPAALAPLVPLTGTVDVHRPGAELTRPPWTGPPPDLAVDLHGNGPASRRLLEALAPARLVGFTGRTWDPGEAETRRWCRLLTEELGIPADPADLDLHPPPVASPAPGAVVIHPGAAYPSRRWPGERFAEVAAALAADGWPVVVSGGPAERALAGAVARLAGLPAHRVLAGATGLAELAALVGGARLVVCGDTGVAHLATAYRTPSVLLFGPTPPQQWGPGRPGPHRVLWHGPHRGDPWGDRLDAALDRIRVSEVVDAARGLLPATGGRQVGSAPPAGSPFCEVPSPRRCNP
jgi:ADP-heptose:LPS heptosyltransferase